MKDFYKKPDLTIEKSNEHKALMEQKTIDRLL